MPLTEAQQALLRELPGVDALLQHPAVERLAGEFSRAEITVAVRTVLSALRARILEGSTTRAALQRFLEAPAQEVSAALQQRRQPHLRRVLNGTGVILQTNLGRAPLSALALQRIAEIGRGYCNLEYDLQAGERSQRDEHAEPLLLSTLQGRLLSHGRAIDLSGWAAAVVNNCAAATFLALNTLSEGGEVIVSRGELVEIGGGFRIPDILARSGAVLREVGTTNKTRLSDYKAALGPQTRLILRVHRSNFRIEGFTEQPLLQELVALGKQASVPVFDDQGTGCLVDLAAFGLRGESSWLDSLASDVSLVAASGDKLLGGPQAGLLVGKREVIERLRRNPLYRAFRVDKLTYAALEATLQAYQANTEADLPLVRMLQLSAGQIQDRCAVVAEKLHTQAGQVEVVATSSVVGGGTTPGANLPSYALALQQPGRSEAELIASLRRLDPPVIGRIRDGRVLLDLRTIDPADDLLLGRLLTLALGQTGPTP